MLLSTTLWVLQLHIQKKSYQAKLDLRDLLKKGSLFLIGISHVIDNLIPSDGATFRSIISLFYISNEGLSILENTDALGIPIPQFLRNRFLSMQEQNNDAHKKSESR